MTDTIKNYVEVKKFKETNLFYYYLAVLTIGMLSINSRITFAQEKNETSEIDNSVLITTSEIDESIETNNTLSQMTNDTS